MKVDLLDYHEGSKAQQGMSYINGTQIKYLDYKCQKATVILLLGAWWWDNHDNKVIAKNLKTRMDVRT